MQRTGQKIIPVGCDDGHHSVKLVFENPENPGTLKEVSYRSSAFKGTGQFISLQGANDTYESDGDTLTVSAEQALGFTLDTRFSGYPLSSLNRILVSHALSHAGFDGQCVKIVTGLPYDQYYSTHQKNQALIDGKISSLKKSVSAKDGRDMPRIVRSDVVSEGVASVFDLLMNPDESLRDEYAKLIVRPISIVDLGGKTLDMVTLQENCRGIYAEFSGTREVGTLRLIANLSAAIKQEFNLSGDPSRDYVDQSFKTGKYFCHGEDHDITHLIRQEAQNYINSITRSVAEIASSQSELGATVYVGGGAALLKNTFGVEIFSEFNAGKVIVPDSPEFANARGMYYKASQLEV